MITDTVNANREATLLLRVRGPSGQEQELEAVIDTGFTGFLTLPPGLVAALSLPRLGRGRAVLAAAKSCSISTRRPRNLEFRGRCGIRGLSPLALSAAPASTALLSAE